MNELSMHILDIVQNSFVVNSNIVMIYVDEDVINNKLTITIKDDGYGMDEETVLKVVDPFYTSRTTRKVGLGISLFKLSSEMCNGEFSINSIKGKGTTVIATYQYDHIDRAPLGDMVETVYLLLINNYGIDIYYQHTYNNESFIFDSRIIKEILNGVSFMDYEIMCWIKEYINEGITMIRAKEDLV